VVALARCRDSLGSDGAEDVLPSGIEGISQPIHELALVAMGMPILNNCDLELVSKEAAKRSVGVSKDCGSRCRSFCGRFGVKSDRNF
jgi:hypothetical protein